MGQDGDNHEDAGAKIPRDKSGIRDPEARSKLKVLAKKMQKRKFATFGKAGESDRKITTKSIRSWSRRLCNSLSKQLSCSQK